MLPSTNKHDWLGQGYYFWENSYNRALDFAGNPPGKKRYNKPSVLGAILDLQYCLNPLDAKYLEIVQDSYFNLEYFSEKFSLELPKNKSSSHTADLLIRKLDCTVIENAHQRVEKNKPLILLVVFLQKGVHYTLVQAFMKRTIYKSASEILIV